LKTQLTRIKEQHLTDLLSWVTSYEEMVQWSGPWNFSFPLDEQQLASFFLAEVLDDGLQRTQFIALDRETQLPVGQIGYSRIWMRTNSAHLGPVIVHPAMRGRGIGSQMVKDVLKIGFGDLRLHRIELVVFDFNQTAIACYERAGFRTEGTLRDIVRVGNKYWHWRAMSILEHEFSSGPGPQSGVLIGKDHCSK